MSIKIKKNPFDKEQNRCRYLEPQSITDIDEKFIRYEYAQKLADEVSF